MSTEVRNLVKEIGGIAGPRTEVWICLDDYLAAVNETLAKTNSQATSKRIRFMSKELTILRRGIIKAKVSK